MHRLIIHKKSWNMHVFSKYGQFSKHGRFSFQFDLKHICSYVDNLERKQKTDMHQTSTLFFFHNCRNHLTSWEVNHDTSCWNLSLQQWCLNSRRYLGTVHLFFWLCSPLPFLIGRRYASHAAFRIHTVWLVYTRGLFKVTNTGSIYWSRRRENKGQARQRYFNCSVRTASQ